MAHEMRMGDDNILRIKFSGDVDQGEVDTYLENYRLHMAAAPKPGAIHFLVDVSQVGKASAAARKVFNETFRNPDPRAGYTALVGANRYMRVMVAFVLRATGSSKLRTFDSEEQALAWLRSLDTTPTDKEVRP